MLYMSITTGEVDAFVDWLTFRNHLIGTRGEAREETRQRARMPHRLPCLSLLHSFCKSQFPHNRQLVLYIGNSKG